VSKSDARTEKIKMLMGFGGDRLLTLHARLHDIERMNGQRGDDTGREAGNRLDQRGREVRMMVVSLGHGGGCTG